MQTSTASALIGALKFVTKDWARQRKSEERERSREFRRYHALVRERESSVKDAAYEVMEAAYLRVSDNKAFPGNVRQIMYACRPSVQEKTGKPLDGKYFTQTLLPDYLREFDVDWDVVFDERGHFTEPHTQRSIGLGTLKVRGYLGQIRPPVFRAAGLRPAYVETFGPEARYSAILFLEKEGFGPLLEQARIAERYDLAIMSTKGVSVTAARKLVDEVCGQKDIPLLVLHDFDISGFSIIGTLRESNRRYEFAHDPRVIDLGLRLEDVKGLQSEQVFTRWSESAIARRLRLNGATREEINFLKKRRVELNAFTSAEFIAFVERKLEANGIEKVVPSRGTLAETYRLFVRSDRVQEIVEAELAKTSVEHVAVPKDLEKRVREVLRKRPEISWDQAVASLAQAEAPPPRKIRRTRRWEARRK